MIDIPFSYYLKFNESTKVEGTVDEGYISLNLYEVAETIGGPVISSNYGIEFYYSKDNLWYVENMFEFNIIVDDSINEMGLDDLFENNTIEISNSVFLNLRAKFFSIIEDGTCVGEDGNEEDYKRVHESIHCLKNYIKRIGLIK